MDITIETVNIDDEHVDFELRHLVKAAFIETALLPAGRLAGNIKSNASRPGFFLVAKENNTIVGCNAFLANDFTVNNMPYVGYQSCWSATHPDHRGKGIFAGIINEAKKKLKDEGAGFIYGLANDNSHPIFVNKLGVKEIASLVTRIPNLPLMKNFCVNNIAIDKVDVCQINEEQVKKHKALQFPSEVKTINYNDSWVWGKYITKVKFGIKIPVFYIGGIHLENENHLKHLTAEIFRQYSVFFIQALSCGTNNLTPLFNGWKKAKVNPFIFFNLNMPPVKHFNIMIGSIDIF